MMKKRMIKIIYSTVVFLALFNVIIGQEVGEDQTSVSKEEQEQQVKEDVATSLNLDSYVSSMNEYVQSSQIEGIDIGQIAKELTEGGKIDYQSIGVKILSLFSKELLGTIIGAITIYILIIIMSLLSSMELEEKSDVTKIAHLACFLTLATITIKSFLDVITLFRNVVTTLTTMMQVVSPFLVAVLIATGAITSTGIIQPMLLFAASLVGFIINYIVIPFISISVAFNVISSISENLKMNKLSKLFLSSSLWVVGLAFTVFLGILSIETSLSSSVDALAVKTTQAAVSNFVPVVGKFFSDSFETVVGATKIISKVGGVIGIFSVVVIAIVPILKIASIMVVYMILSALIEPLCHDESITKYISGFAATYKTILGVLIGVSILFIISTGIILNLASSVVT